MSLSIPTAARGQVRAFVKAHKNFDAFAANLGVPSREVKNADLIVFAAVEGLLDQVNAIIASATGCKPTPFATESLNEAVAASVILETHDRVMANIEAAVAQESAGKQPEGAFTFEQVVADVDQFLSPFVRKAIEDAVKPIIVAANKPAVVVEVPAAPLAPVGVAPYAVKTGGTVEFSKLFGVRTTQAYGKRAISLWSAHGRAPAIDPFYVVNAETMASIATAAEHEANVWFVGPSGSGKTTLPEQFAAYTGRPFVKIGFTRQTEVGELVGNQGFKEGHTFWEDGVLIAAMRRPGTVILFDEPTIAPAGVQAIIQGVTDEHRSYTIHATGEVVKAAPGVVFIVADNTNGAGDETGQYAGTNQSNAALVNRFSRMVRVEYMSKAQETNALVNHTGIPHAAAEHVADFMARARRLPEMEGVVLSLRQMVGFVRTVKDGFNAKTAFEMAILTRLPNTERAAIETMATLQWSEQFEQLLTGDLLTPVAEVTSQPDYDSLAAKAFDDEVSASLNR